MGEMKRTPLKRGNKPLKRRTPLARVSLKKSEWRQLYRLKRDGERKPCMTCADCLGLFDGNEMEPHHPAGQVGARILVFVWLCKPCHKWIHDRGQWARETGRLLPEFSGRKSTTETVNYFNVKLP